MWVEGSVCATVWKSLLRGYCPANAHRELHGFACVVDGLSLRLPDVDMKFLSVFYHFSYLYSKPMRQLFYFQITDDLVAARETVFFVDINNNISSCKAVFPKCCCQLYLNSPYWTSVNTNRFGQVCMCISCCGRSWINYFSLLFSTMYPLLLPMMLSILTSSIFFDFKLTVLPIYWLVLVI